MHPPPFAVALALALVVRTAHAESTTSGDTSAPEPPASVPSETLGAPTPAAPPATSPVGVSASSTSEAQPRETESSPKAPTLPPESAWATKMRFSVGLPLIAAAGLEQSLGGLVSIGVNTLVPFPFAIEGHGRLYFQGHHEALRFYASVGTVLAMSGVGTKTFVPTGSLGFARRYDKDSAIVVDLGAGFDERGTIMGSQTIAVVNVGWESALELRPRW